MLEIATIIGLCVMMYYFLVGIVMFFKKCSIEEAKKRISAFFKQNNYELSNDLNYKQAINTVVKDVLGKSRYEELLALDKYDSTLRFCDNHDGLPSVKITVNCNNENEKKCLGTIVESTTNLYLLNYEDSVNIKLLSNWSQNETLQLPMLILQYSRNEREYKMLDSYIQTDISKIASKYGEVFDGTDDLL